MGTNLSNSGLSQLLLKLANTKKERALRADQKVLNEDLADVIKQASKSIKLMNYEIKRVVANEDETFIHLGHN